MINTSAHVGAHVASNPVTTVTSTTLTGAAPTTIRYRNASSSVSSSDEESRRPEVSRKSRAGEKLAAAVGQFLLKHPNAYGAQPGPAQVEAVVTTQGGQVVGEQIKSNTDATTTAALLAVAQNLLQSKYKAHKHSKYDDQVGAGVESSSKFYKNKALIQSTALTVLPFVREQIKTLSGGHDISVDANGNPKLDSQTIKAIAAVTKKMIRGQASGATTTGVSGATDATAGVKSGLSGKAVAAASIARKFMKQRKSGTKSASSSSSSDSDSGSGKGKKVVLLAAGAAVARQLVTRLNRRKARKEVKTQIATEKEPTKLEALKAKLAHYRQRSPSSSPDDVETKKKSAALLAAATTVAKKLTEARLLQRKSNLTEEQYNTKLAAVPTKLQRTESASSSDEEAGVVSKNKAMLTAAKLFVQHQINKVFRRDRTAATTTAGTTVTTGVTTTTEAEKRRKRDAALAAAATLSTRYFLAKSDTHKHHHRSVKGAQAEAVGVSKAVQHRHKSSSSSSGSSSSSDEEGEGANKRMAAVTALGAGIAKKLVEQLNRKQSRTTLKSQIATEKDASKLDALKARLAAFRSASPDAHDSDSSDEESHKKRNLILASATAAAGLLLKQRLDARKQKGLITETVYNQKVASIPSQLAVGTLASGVVGTGISSTAVNTNVTGLTTTATVLSSDDEVVVGKSRKSLLLPAQQLVNRLVTRNYRKQYPRRYKRHQVYGNPATGVVVEKERPRAWVKAAQGVALSLLRETANRQHYTKGAATTTGVITSAPVTQTIVEETIVQKPITETYTATNVGTGLGVGLATGAALGTGLTTGHSAQYSSTAYVAPTTTTSYSTTTVPTTTSYSTTTVPTTTAYTTTSVGGRGYEMVDAAVKVKRHGLTNLVYEDLGYFVTLKLDYDYLHSRGILKPGDKLKHLLKVKNQNQFSLDNAVDESTKQIIKQSLGLDTRDSIKLEYTGLPGGAVLSSDSVSSGLEDVYVTPEEARVRNLTTSEKLKNKFSRKNRTPVAYGTVGHVSKVDKLKSKLHGHHDDPTYIPGPNTHGVGL